MSRHILAIEEEKDPRFQFGVFKIGSESKVSRHVTDRQIELFLENSSSMKDFKEINFQYLQSLSEKSFIALLSHPKFSKLETFTMQNCNCFSDAVLSVIVTSNLKRLALNNLKFVNSEGYIKLFTEPSSLMNLEYLQLKSAYTFDDAALAALSQCQLPNLTRLDLRKCDKLTIKGFKTLSESPFLPRITHLNISVCYKLDGGDLREFLNPTSLRSLRHLKIKGLTGLRDADLEWIINSEVGKQLKTLSFKYCRFSDSTYQALLNAKLNSLTKLTIPITSWYLEEIVNSPAMSQVTCLEIYDIRPLVDHQSFKGKQEEFSKFDIIPKRIDEILSNSKQLVNLTKLKVPSACSLPKFWKSDNCLKLKAFSSSGKDVNKAQKKKSVKRFVTMPSIETQNQILHDFKAIVVPSGSDYILGKDLSHVESLFIENIQDVYHLATAKFQKLRTLTVSLKDDHGIARFAEIDMRPAKLAKLNIKGNYNWSLFAEVIPMSKNFLYLQSIKMGVTGVSNNYLESFKNLRALRYLKKITFSAGSITISALSTIIANVPGLEEISLRECTLEQEAAPKVGELIDFKGVIKTHREHFFENIYLEPCSFRLIIKKKVSGRYYDGRTSTLSKATKEKPYGDFSIILVEAPNWNNEDDGGYYGVQRTLDKFSEYYEKDSRDLHWIKTWDSKGVGTDSLVGKPILDKCTGLKSLRSYTGGLSIFAAYANSLESLQTITTRFLPEEADIQLFGPYMCTVMVISDKAYPFDVLKGFCQTLITHEKCKLVNTFLIWEYGNKGGKELSPFDEVVNLVTSTRLKDFRYVELPTYKFEFTPENKEALKVILIKLTTLKNNQTLLLSLLTKLVQLFDKHLEAFKEDDEKDEQVLEYFAKIFKDSNDIAEIICFYAMNYNRAWLRRSILKITAPMPMTQEEIKRLYLREIWDTTFTDIYFLKDETEIHNPLAFEYAFKEFQAKPDDKIVLRIVDKVLSNLSPEQLKAMPKTKEPGYIFRHPLFYDTECPWTFAEYSLTLKDLDVYLNKHSKDMADNNKKMILWEKADNRHIDNYFAVLDCTRIKELVFDLLKLPLRQEFHPAVESLHLKTVTFKADSTNVSVYNFGNRWLPDKMYDEIERINIEIINMTHLNAEPWKWLVQVLENIQPNCTLNITAENNGKCVVPLEVKELPVLKVKKLILQGKTAFNFFSELHSKMKIQTLECLQVKIKRKPNDNWDEEKTDENEKKVLTYISKLKGNLNNIRIDIPLKLNSLIDILETPQWLQIKNFRIMSSGTNEELELIARAKNLNRLKTLHVDFSQRISHGESLTLFSQGIKALLSGAKDILKELDWGRFFSEHSKYGLISHEIVKVAIKKNIFKEPSFKQWTLYTPHHKFPILAEDVIKVLENTDVNNFDIAQFIARNKDHPAITPKVYCYYVSGQFRNKILSLATGPTPITFQDKKSQTHTNLLDLLYTDKLTQARLDGMIENQPLSIDDDFINIMCAFVSVINKHQIVIRTLHDKHKNITSTGLNRLLKTFQYPQYPSLYKWVIDSTHYLQMTDLENLELLSRRDIRFFDIRKLHLSSHKFLYPCSNEESAILLDPSKMVDHQSELSDDAKHKRDAIILGLITQCYSLQWLHLDKLDLDDVFCMKLAVLHNEKLKNKNKLQLISIKENPYITFVGLKFLYSIPIADENFQQSHYGIIANCEVILDIPAVVALNDGIHAAVKSKFREYKRKKKARGLRYFDHTCIPMMLYSIICFPFAFFQYFDEEITQMKYLSKVRRAIAKVGDKFRGLLNIQAKKAEYVYFADMDDDQDKESGNRLRYIFSQGCIKLNAFFRNRKIWILLYVLHAMLYYFIAIFFPFWFVTECDSGEENYSHIAYGIYAGIATISEAWLLRKCVEIINNDQIAQFKLMIIVPLAISQNNKLSLYTDVLYLTTAYSCGNSTKAIISTISLLIFLVMNIIQIFNLLVEYIGIRKNSQTHNSTYIDLVAKFCYSTDLTTISALLEKISICCADQVGRVYVPQILQTIGLKSLTRTFPQAVLQLISYLTSGFSSSSVVYLVSFVVSIVNLILAFYSLITAQPSACTPATVKRVFYKDFKSRLQQVKDSPKKKPKKISPTIVETATMTKKEEKTSFSKCIKNLKRKIDRFTASKNEARLPAKTIGTDIQTLLRAHKKATVNRYEEAVTKLKAKYTRKGKVSGYYIQGGECPIEGTYTMVDGVIDMHSEDSAGSAKWDGVISIFSGVAKIAKRYEGRHFVGYNGDINWDNKEDVEVNGFWSMGSGGGGAGFKLVFKREEDEIEHKMSPADPVEETQLIDNPSKDFDRK